MIGMRIKRISVLNLYHVLKPFVKSTPEDHVCVYRLISGQIPVGYMHLMANIVSHTRTQFNRDYTE